MSQMRSILQGLLSAKKTDRTKALDGIEYLLMDESMTSYDSENIAGQLMDLLDSEIYSTYTKCKNNKIKDHTTALNKIIHIAEVLRKLVKKTFIVWEKSNILSKFYNHVEAVMYSREALFIVTEYIKMAEYILEKAAISSEWCLKYVYNLIQIYKDSTLDLYVGDYKVFIDGKPVLSAIVSIVEHHYYFIIPISNDLMEFISLVLNTDKDYNQIVIALTILNLFTMNGYPNHIELHQSFLLTHIEVLQSLFRPQHPHLVKQIVIFLNLSISILFGTSLIDDCGYFDNFPSYFTLLEGIQSTLEQNKIKDLTLFNNLLPFLLYTSQFPKYGLILYERSITDNKELSIISQLNCMVQMISRVPTSNDSGSKRSKSLHILSAFLEQYSPQWTCLIIILCKLLNDVDYSLLIEPYLINVDSNLLYFYSYVFNKTPPSLLSNETINWHYLVCQSQFLPLHPSCKQSILYIYDLSDDEFLKLDSSIPFYEMLKDSKDKKKLFICSQFNKEPKTIEICTNIAMATTFLYEFKTLPFYLYLEPSVGTLNENTSLETAFNLIVHPMCKLASDSTFECNEKFYKTSFGQIMLDPCLKPTQIEQYLYIIILNRNNPQIVLNYYQTTIHDQCAALLEQYNLIDYLDVFSEHKVHCPTICSLLDIPIDLFNQHYSFYYSIEDIISICPQVSNKLICKVFPSIYSNSTVAKYVKKYFKEAKQLSTEAICWLPIYSYLYDDKTIINTFKHFLKLDPDCNVVYGLYLFHNQNKITKNYYESVLPLVAKLALLVNKDIQLVCPWLPLSAIKCDNCCLKANHPLVNKCFSHLQTLELATLPVVIYASHYSKSCSHTNLLSKCDLKLIEHPDIVAHQVYQLINQGQLKKQYSCDILLLLIPHIDWHLIYPVLHHFVPKFNQSHPLLDYLCFIFDFTPFELYKDNDPSIMICHPKLELQSALQTGEVEKYHYLPYFKQSVEFDKIKSLYSTVDVTNTYYKESLLLLEQWESIEPKKDKYTYLKEQLFPTRPAYAHLKRINALKSCLPAHYQNALDLDCDASLVYCLSLNKMDQIDLLLFLLRLYPSDMYLIPLIEQVKEFDHYYYTLVQQNRQNPLIHSLVTNIGIKQQLPLSNQLDQLLLQYECNQTPLQTLLNYTIQIKHPSHKLCLFLHQSILEFIQNTCAIERLELVKKKAAMTLEKNAKRQLAMEQDELAELQLEEMCLKVITTSLHSCQHSSDLIVLQSIFYLLSTWDIPHIEDLLIQLDATQYTPLLPFILGRNEEPYLSLMHHIIKNDIHPIILPLLSSVSHDEENKPMMMKAKQQHPIVFKQYMNYYTALVQLCRTPSKSIKHNKLPSNSLLTSIKDSIVLYKSSRIKVFHQSCIVQHGLSQPKQVTLALENGTTHQLLLKGNDDMKQDALIQHVITKLNYILTKKNNSVIQTYWIQPLAPKTGVLEWINQSIPIGVYMHKIQHLYENHYTMKECREMYADSKSSSDKMKCIEEIWAKNKSIFKHFYFSTFKDPESFVASKVNYCKSMGIYNVVNALLGIGDRHLMNIMVNEHSGELIHIDFGFAFEQAKLLPCPEYIPFRLTRELVDCCGVYRLQGPYRVIMEKCLTWFREQDSFITSSIEILKHDPLVSWTTREEKMSKIVKDYDKKVVLAPLSADMVILQIKRKLNNGTSVENQIKKWNEQAQNIKLLAQLFHGWQPWH